jgi:hypothetical protein
MSKTPNLIISDKGKIKKANKKRVLKIATAALFIALGIATVGLIKTGSSQAQCWTPPGGSSGGLSY